MNTFFKAAGYVLVGALAACASPQYQQPVATPVASPYPAPVQTYPVASPAYVTSYGVVDSIQVSQVRDGGMGVGAIAGGVVGGLLGTQVGGGRGKKAATVAGAIGGAMVGHEMERRNAQPATSYQVGVRLDNGSYRTFPRDNVADLQVGSRVRIENEQLYRF